MSEIEYKSASNPLLVRDSIEVQPLICDALEGGEPFMDLVGLFYNGDIQPIYVCASHHKLTVMLDMPIYSDQKGYQIINSNLITKITGDCIIFDLARLLNEKWLLYIINHNKHLLDPMISWTIEVDSDRGYQYNMTLYRINGGEFIAS